MEYGFRKQLHYSKYSSSAYLDASIAMVVDLRI